VVELTGGKLSGNLLLGLGVVDGKQLEYFGEKPVEPPELDVIHGVDILSAALALEDGHVLSHVL